MSDKEPLPGEQATMDQRHREPVPEAALRALEEAAQRRVIAEKSQVEKKKEINGREGPDPARYGDWEKKGIAVDF